MKRCSQSTTRQIAKIADGKALQKYPRALARPGFNLIDECAEHTSRAALLKSDP